MNALTKIIKKYGRRKAGTYGRLGSRALKRAAGKAVRKQGREALRTA